LKKSRIKVCKVLKISSCSKVLGKLIKKVTSTKEMSMFCSRFLIISIENILEILKLKFQLLFKLLEKILCFSASIFSLNPFFLRLDLLIKCVDDCGKCLLKNLKLTNWSLLLKWVTCTKPMMVWWLGPVRIAGLQVARWALTCIGHDKKLNNWINNPITKD
jgi:hypothetical protein